VSAAVDAARARRERALLLGVQLALLLPFLAKPIHIDDAFFLAIAEQIARDPLHPFDFAYNWTGVPDLVAREMKNPPLVFYFQALWHSLGIAVGVDAPGHFDEHWLHAGFAPFAIVATQAFYSLAARATSAPLLPALLLATCPAFWVSATSAMIDVPLVAAMLVALLALERAREAASPLAPAFTAGVAASAAVLSKYAAVVLLPAAAAPIVAAGARAQGAPRSRVALSLAAALPALAFLLWFAASDGHPLGALAYRSQERLDLLTWLAAQLPAALAFSGALLAFPIAAFAAAFAREGERGIALVASGVAVFACALRRTLLPHDGALANDALMFAASGGASAFALLAARALRRERAPLARGFALWLAAGFAFLLANWTVNARSVLLLAPPAALAFALASEGRRGLRSSALALSVALGALVVAADAELAAFGPSEAARMQREARDGARVRFVGHWGYQHYMERAGFEPVDLSRPDLRAGDVVAIPRMHRVASIPFALPKARESRERAVARTLPIAVMDVSSGAGLHGSFLGPLPFAFARTPLEVVEVLAW